jgi:hypothetical protein
MLADVEASFEADVTELLRTVDALTADDIENDTAPDVYAAAHMDAAAGDSNTAAAAAEEEAEEDAAAAAAAAVAKQEAEEEEAAEMDAAEVLALALPLMTRKAAPNKAGTAAASKASQGKNTKLLELLQLLDAEADEAIAGSKRNGAGSTR